MRCIAAFDIGNTRIKVALFHAGHIRGTFSLPTLLDSQDIAELRERLSRWNVEEALVCSVVPASREILLESLKELHIATPLILASDGKIFEYGVASGDFLDTPQTTGVDRVLAGIGARTMAGDSHAIVVTAGSAITVNLMTVDDQFRGGAIFPGLKLMAGALHLGTAALPLWNFDATQSIPSALGRSTVTAIHAGIFHAAAAGVERLIEQLTATLAEGEKTRIFLTGGDAEILRRAIRRPHQVAPHLVLQGLHHVYQHARAEHR